MRGRTIGEANLAVLRPTDERVVGIWSFIRGFGGGSGVFARKEANVTESVLSWSSLPCRRSFGGVGYLLRGFRSANRKSSGRCRMLILVPFRIGDARMVQLVGRGGMMSLGYFLSLEKGNQPVPQNRKVEKGGNKVAMFANLVSMLAPVC